MKPQPVSRPLAVSYPDRRQFLKLLGTGTLAFSLWHVAKGDDKKDETRNKPKSPAALKKQIATLAATLGSEDFKERRIATAKLIQLGKGEGKDKNADAETRKLVLAKMTELKKAKDPEISERARNIIVALTPKPVPPPPLPPSELEGLIEEIK